MKVLTDLFLKLTQNFTLQFCAHDYYGNPDCKYNLNIDCQTVHATSTRTFSFFRTFDQPSQRLEKNVFKHFSSFSS